MDFNEWIAQKYLEWRGDAIGREGSVSAFSRWVGVPQSLMNDWLQPGGKKPTSAKAINALVARFGGEVYDVLNLRPPAEPLDADLRELHILMEMLKQIPPEKLKDLSLAVYAWALSEGIQIDDTDVCAQT